MATTSIASSKTTKKNKKGAPKDFVVLGYTLCEPIEMVKLSIDSTTSAVDYMKGQKLVELINQALRTRFDFDQADLDEIQGDIKHIRMVNMKGPKNNHPTKFSDYVGNEWLLAFSDENAESRARFEEKLQKKLGLLLDENGNIRASNQALKDEVASQQAQLELLTGTSKQAKKSPEKIEAKMAELDIRTQYNLLKKKVETHDSEIQSLRTDHDSKINSMRSEIDAVNQKMEDMESKFLAYSIRTQKLLARKLLEQVRTKSGLTGLVSLREILTRLKDVIKLDNEEINAIVAYKETANRMVHGEIKSDQALIREGIATMSGRLRVAFGKLYFYQYNENFEDEYFRDDE